MIVSSACEPHREGRETQAAVNNEVLGDKTGIPC